MISTLSIGLADAVSRKPLPARVVCPRSFSDVFGVAEVTVGAVLSTTIASPPVAVVLPTKSVTITSPPKSPVEMVSVI